VRWGENESAVHLGQLVEALGRELGVEEEPARADGEDIGTIAYDDESTHTALEDAIKAFAQGLAGRHRSESLIHRRTSPDKHGQDSTA